VLGNVLATVYTTNICVFIDVSWRYDIDRTGKRRKKVLFLQEEVHKK
jgi:hypothetical protein